MQLIPRYLVSNRINLLANEAGFVVEYRPVYQRNLQLYKGIENVLEFRLLNADQKPIDVSAYTPRFVAFDENNNMVIEHDGVSLQAGDSTEITFKGLFKVTVTENDLLNIDQQYLKYNIFLVDANNSNVLTYSNPHFDNDGTIFVSDRAFPAPKATYSIETFTQSSVNSNEWVSETLDAEPAINGNEALHTAAIYTDTYAGNITVQATLENQVTGTTKWADITTLSLTGSETDPTPINFYGVFSYIRFVTDASPADKITKILVRN